MVILQNIHKEAIIIEKRCTVMFCRSNAENKFYFAAPHSSSNSNNNEQYGGIREE
jgi:hypothetical protein